MPSDFDTLTHGNKVVGYRGKEAGKDWKYKKQEGPAGPALGELEKKGTEPMPKQGDYASTSEFADAMRKWRDRQRSASEAANALASKK